MSCGNIMCCYWFGNGVVISCGIQINEMSWSLHSDHILLATGGSEMGGVEVVHFDGEELSKVRNADPSRC